MLVASLIWLYILVLSVLFGWPLIHLAGRLTRSDPSQVLSFPLVSITGLCCITVLVGFAGLFINLGLLVNLCLLIGAGLILWIYHNDLLVALRRSLAGLLEINPVVWVLLAALFLLALMRATGLPLNYDTGLYHAQAIRWMEAFPAVPGLGNLHYRLAFNSSWFLPSALFSFSFIGSGSFHVVDGLFYLLIIAYGITKFARLLKGDARLSNIAGILVVFLGRYLYALELSSPGTDMPAALLVWLVFLLSLEKIEHGESTRFNVHSILILLFSVWALTIKLSVLPILLLPAYFTVREYHLARRNSLAVCGMTLLIILLPWVARSVIQSGYLVFPVVQSGLRFLDWRVPPSDVQNAAQAITSWSRLPGVDQASVMQMTYSEWVPTWFKALQATDKRLLLAIALSILLLVGYLVFNVFHSRRTFGELPKYVILYVTSLVGIAYWFLQAPATRFGYGFLGSMLCLSATPILKAMLNDFYTMRRLIVYALLIGMLLYQGIGIYNRLNDAEVQARLVYPATYPVIEVKEEGFGNFTTYSPASGDQCWYADLPCTPINNPGVNLRSSSLSGGFFDKRLKK